MFTGIIQNFGTIKDIHKDGDWNLMISTSMDLDKTPIGASIACNGCCLTVVEKGKDWFSADVSGETLSKTTIGNWRDGMKINLEPSLKLGDELGGHFVFGHVDGLAVIESIEKDGDSHRLWMKAPEGFERFLAAKGSVSLDGVSLTVNAVEKDGFAVNIIEHTWKHTTLSDRQPGDELNFEVDMLARYVERMIGKAA